LGQDSWLDVSLVGLELLDLVFEDFFVAEEFLGLLLVS
jgi:hypothetical protein